MAHWLTNNCSKVHNNNCEWDASGALIHTPVGYKHKWINWAVALSYWNDGQCPKNCQRQRR